MARSPIVGVGLSPFVHGLGFSSSFQIGSWLWFCFLQVSTLGLTPGQKTEGESRKNEEGLLHFSEETTRW